MKLKIELYRYGELFFGRIVEQDKDLKNMPDLKKDGLAIGRFICLYLTEKVLFIRGSDTKQDDKTFSCECDTIESAIDLCNKIKKP